MKKTVFALVLLSLQVSLLSAQSTKDSLELELTELIQRSEIPGLGVSIASEKGILYSGGFGLRDVKHKLQYDSLTVQPIASISKTMIGISIMILVEKGKVDLDTDINSILPFKIVNPYFPNSKITLMQLATHTSSIQDTDATDDGTYFILEREASKAIFPKGSYRYYQKYLKNAQVEYEDYLESYLSVEGRNFDKKVFGKYEPGEQFSYSNIGASLAAYIVELVAGEPFEVFTQKYIFDPLEMKHTRWKKSDINTSNFALPYFQNGSKVPTYNTSNSFPASMLHTHSHDMGKFMVEIINGYNGNGRLLNNESYQQMMSDCIRSNEISENRGIFWSINREGNIGHDGAEIGTATRLVFSPRLNKAFFVMKNISSFEDERLTKDSIQILIILSKYAKALN